jgi:hypothetical protein
MAKPEGKRPLARPNRKGEDNIKMDPQKIGWGAGWILMAQDGNRWRTHVNSVMNIGFHKMARYFLAV